MNNCHNQSFRKSDLKHLRPHISQYFFSAIRKKEHKKKKNQETQARNSGRYWLDLHVTSKINSSQSVFVGNYIETCVAGWRVSTVVP